MSTVELVDAEDVEKVLSVGNLKLPMGSVSHAVGVQKTSFGLDLYLRYSAYQLNFSK